MFDRKIRKYLSFVSMNGSCISMSKRCLVIGITIVTVVAIGLGLLIYFLAKNGNNNVECDVDPFGADPPPIVVLSGTSTFVYPKLGEKRLRFSSGQSLEFTCPGRKVILGSFENDNAIVQGTCVSGTTFKINGKELQWNEVKCNDVPWRSARYTGNECEENGREIEVGFDIGDRFIRSMTICFGQELQIAHYTYINQTAAINQRVLDTPRPSWLQGSEFYDIGTVTNLYLRGNQRRTINSLIGLNSTSTKYIQDNTNYFLARGHMTARSDNFYSAQQNATFFMMNIAPQWQTFNGFNWNQVEIDVRDYAENQGVDLQVWTGVYGVTTLPHEDTGEDVELYLYVNETSNRKALPVPSIYWKVAYDPITERGIALIGVNNPFHTSLTTICVDVSLRLTWLHYKRDDQQHGFCYACSVDAFSRVVTSMPNIPIRGLLL